MKIIYGILIIHLSVLAHFAISAEPMNYAEYPQNLSDAKCSELIELISSGTSDGLIEDTKAEFYDKLVYTGLHGWKAIMHAECNLEKRFDPFRARIHAWEISRYPRPLIEAFLSFAIPTNIQHKPHPSRGLGGRWSCFSVRRFFNAPSIERLF